MCVCAAHLVLVLDDVGVDLVECAQAVELAEVKAGLLRQVRAHVLVTDGRHPGDVRVVPEHGGEREQVEKRNKKKNGQKEREFDSIHYA